MTPVAHFIISMGIAFCLGFRHPRRYAAVFALGVLGVLPDLDHLLPTIDGVGLFHNTLALGIIPLFMIMMAVVVETRNGESSVYQRFSVCAAVILFSHLLLDMLSGRGIHLGFPTSAGSVALLPYPVLELQGAGVLVVSTDFLWVCLLGLTVAGNLVQKKIYEVFEGYDEFPEYGEAPFPYWAPDSLLPGDASPAL